MKNKSKLVSIILNCYNGSSFLKEALTSIKNQTYKNWEVIFWDNRSSDNSKDILKSFRNKKELSKFPNNRFTRSCEALY